MSSQGSVQRKWWKEAVVYQIYPSSFLDSNNDGWGDLPGIISKVDYLKELGVDVIWLSPIYKSPMADMGYDINKDIDPKYGTLDDVASLIKKLNEKGMKLMMDLVVNHTSTEHDWFRESRSSKSNSKRDWYIWRPARFRPDGTRQPPNNWSQILGEQNSAWTWDEETQEYFLTLFTPDQADLNWENPDVRAAVHDILRFWLDKGVSGFRMDVINFISKVSGFPNADITNPEDTYQPGQQHYANGPRLHEYLHAMNREVLSKYDAITVGEMPCVRDPEEIIKVVGADRDELNMIFIFDFVEIDNALGASRLSLRSWDASEVRDILAPWQQFMLDRNGWNSVFCENHDNPRSVSRYCDDKPETRHLGAKLLALMLTTLHGTLYLYQGQEIGQKNVPATWGPEEYKDVESVNFYKRMVERYPGDEEKRKYAMHVLQRKARDHSRTPVQWTAESPNAGFCPANVKPWMRVNEDYESVNVEAQMHGPEEQEKMSVWQFWQRGLAARKEHIDVFVYGDYKLVGDVKGSKVFAYTRTGKQIAFVAVLNFSAEEVEWDIPNDIEVRKWVGSNYTNGDSDHPTSGRLHLKSWEGILAIAAP